MKRKSRRRAVEVLKDVTIVALTISTLYLTVRSQSIDGFSDSWLGGIVQAIRGEGAALPAPGEFADPRQVPVYPARIVVTNPDLVHYGAQYDSAAVDELFSGTFSVLGEALSTAGEPRRITEGEWRAALTGRAGVYFDFMGRYPLGTLLSWLEQGSVNAALTGTARRVLLAEDGKGNALLYYHNADDGSYYACGTSGAVPGHLRFAVEGRSGLRVTSAFEYGEEASGDLDPYDLIGSDPPSAPVYRAEDPLGGLESQEDVWALLAGLKGLGFQAQAGAPYQTGGGEWVVNDGQDQLRISGDGTISFYAGEEAEPRYRVLQAGETPTATELLDAVQPIAAGTVGTVCGDARIYLIGLEKLRDGGWAAEFGYSLDGAAVQLYGADFAARFILRDGAVKEYTLRFRRYTATGEEAALLPELQAAAAMTALERQGGELLLRYEDNGGESVSPFWTAG